MKKLIPLLPVLLAAACFATPAFAFTYPVSGRYGQSTETKPGPIDCTGKRIIRFDDRQRFDSKGGVPNYRLFNLETQGTNGFRVTEQFNTAQINTQFSYILRLIDSDRVELVMSPGGTLKLKRCI
jgi:hypothetical protein